ncbi:MAG: RagB/SusD family nutrient uptake outer membrane protein [Prevotellaceae bacterium]|jgi:hypothetical protein|nr:RagB/SusD family nutrient uptake outer membrane protein [Prevotellaceae bacterium]
MKKNTYKTIRRSPLTIPRWPFAVGRLFLALLLLTGMTGCLKETFPKDHSALGKEIAKASPAYLAAGIDAWMISHAVGSWGDRHYDFGYPSIMIMTEMEGQDLAPVNRYNTFGSFYTVQNLGPDYATVQVPWLFFTRLLKLANISISTLEGANAGAEETVVRAQAYAYRAFAYFQMAQLYQYTYKGHEEAPAVPVVPENMTIEQARNNPRATVETVYRQILSDLATAEKLMTGLPYSRPSAAKINLNVIQALLARVYLVMHEFDKAQQYAALAKTGFRPLTEAQYFDDATGFNDLTAQQSWIWGLDVTVDDDCTKTGIINFPGQMCNTYRAGYAGAGNIKMIDAALYHSIPDADWRKDTWLAADTAIVPSYRLPKYSSLKFKPYAGNMNNSRQACDIPLIRMEEMMLIEAEAAARGSAGLEAGKKLLDDFLSLRTRSGQSQQSQAASLDDFINEIWQQRRIEFWGEGIAFFDIKRLEKGITRSYPGTNHQVGARYNTDTTPYWMNLCIVRSETNTNQGIPPEMNNPSPQKPADRAPL